MEDVMVIILNVKKIVFKLELDEIKMLEIDVKGFVNVIVGDIIGDVDVEVLNLDLLICIVVDGVYFYMCMIVNIGCGYVFVEDNKYCEDDMLIGVLVVDLLYFLIECVNY